MKIRVLFFVKERFFVCLFSEMIQPVENILKMNLDEQFT